MSIVEQVDEKLNLILKFIQELQQFQCRGSLNIEEAAVYLGISESTLYKHTSARNIAFYKPRGKLICFRKEDLDKWLFEQRIPANRELM